MDELGLKPGAPFLASRGRGATAVVEPQRGSRGLEHGGECAGEGLRSGVGALRPELSERELTVFTMTELSWSPFLSFMVILRIQLLEPNHSCEPSPSFSETESVLAKVLPSGPTLLWGELGARSGVYLALAFLAGL